MLIVVNIEPISRILTCKILQKSLSNDICHHMLLPLQNSQQADICQLGMDQRKVNVLAREYCDDIKRKNKPIILSHRMLLIPLFKTCVMILFSFLNKVRLTPHFMNADMLPGLQQGQEKMSKSDPSSSIFMEDEEVCSGFMYGEFKRSCNVSEFACLKI